MQVRKGLSFAYPEQAWVNFLSSTINKKITGPNQIIRYLYFQTDMRHRYAETMNVFLFVFKTHKQKQMM